MTTYFVRRHWATNVSRSFKIGPTPFKPVAYLLGTGALFLVEGSGTYAAVSSTELTAASYFRSWRES